MRNELKAELLIGQEEFQLIKEDKKYALMTLALYSLSFCGLRTTRFADAIKNAHIIRSSYWPMRRMDNWLDLDRTNLSTHVAYVKEVQNRLGSGFPNKESNIENLLNHAVTLLDERTQRSDNPRGDFIKALDAMIEDSQRAELREVYTEIQLEDFFHRLFDPLINIYLLGLNSKFRSQDLPALSSGQGWVYSRRDLKDDWELGFINIPAKLFAQAKLEKSSSADEVIYNQVVNEWFQQKLLKTKLDLLDTKNLIHDSGERQTYAGCVLGLINPMLNYIDNYPKPNLYSP